MSPRPQILPPPITTSPPAQTSTSTSTSTTSDPTSTSTTSTTSSTTTPTTTSTSTTTTSTTPTSTSTSTTSSSTDTTTSTTTSSSSTDITTSSTTSSTSPTSTSTSTTSSISTTSSTTSGLVVTNSNGQVTTSTTVVVVTPTVSSSTDNSNSSSSKGFFHNTGAVAGVFTVVGLVALVLLIAVVTNAVRRRRAKKLDREIAEAAAEAAGTTPAFTDDDYYPGDRIGKGNQGGDLRSLNTGYSDTTHGTFSQPPMSHGGESYNMAELGPYNEYGAAAGAAGIGAMGLNRARSQTAPYNAFAGPQPPMPNPYDDPAYGQQQGYGQRATGGAPERDLLDAAGLGAAGGAAAGYAANHTGYGQNPTSDYNAYAAQPQVQAGYMQDYNPYQGQQAQYNAYQQGPPQGYAPQAAYGAAVAGGSPPPQQKPEANTSAQRPLSTVSAADPYGGYVDEPASMDNRGSLPSYTTQPGGVRAPSPGQEKLLSGNFASPPASSEGHEHFDNRMSYQDEDDYGYEPKRVLKVANE